jgi:hypothetical protein
MDTKNTIVTTKPIVKDSVLAQLIRDEERLIYLLSCDTLQ